MVMGLIQVESGYRKYAISSVGARGYMQIMPFWMRLIGDGDIGKLFHMQTNLRFGCVILRHYMDRERAMPIWRWAATTAAGASPSIRMPCSARSGAGWWKSRSRSDTVTWRYTEKKRAPSALFSLVSARKNLKSFGVSARSS
jgi:hypothetical protein